MVLRIKRPTFDYRRGIKEIHLGRRCGAQDARLNDVLVERAEIAWPRNCLLNPITFNRGP